MQDIVGCGGFVKLDSNNNNIENSPKLDLTKIKVSSNSKKNCQVKKLVVVYFIIVVSSVMSCILIAGVGSGKKC